VIRLPIACQYLHRSILYYDIMIDMVLSIKLLSRMVLLLAVFSAHNG
jgi:hypothetical protein